MDGDSVDVQGITLFNLFKGNLQDLDFVLGTVLQSSCLSQDLLSVKWLGLFLGFSSCALTQSISHIFLRATAHRTPPTNSVLFPVDGAVVCRPPWGVGGGGNLPHGGSSQVFIIKMFSDIWARTFFSEN